jgi:hypothetical protein
MNSSDQSRKHSSLPDYAEEGSFQSVASGDAGVRRVRRWIISGTVLVFLIILVPPLYRLAKEWRSAVLLRKSESAFATGDPSLAISLLKQSLALSPGSLTVQHAVELYNARSGDQSSLNKLLERMHAKSSDPDELLGIAELEISMGHPELVKEALDSLPVNMSENQSLRRTLVVASMMAQRGELAKAAETCLTQAKVFSREGGSRLRVQASLYLLATRNPEELRRAVELLQQVINDHGKASLAAWRLLAKLVLAPPQGATEILSQSQIVSLINSLDSLTGRASFDSLTAADLEMRQNPDGKETIIRRLKAKYRLASRVETLEFARWLNARGFHQDVVQLAGPERSLQDTDWLLIVLDAQTSLGEWKEVARMIDSPAGAGIPDAVRHLFLARVAMVNGDAGAAEEEWRNVGGALHLEKPETLAYVAGYEEQIEAYDRAARTYRELADREATRIPGLIGLIRCQPRDASASKLIPLYEELLLASPTMGDARCDLAYLRLLSGDDIQKSSVEAQSLLGQQPDSLSRISVAALGKLREGDPKGALELYNGKTIDWVNAPEQWRIVWFAVLKSNGKDGEYDGKIFSWNAARIRPEERTLLDLVAGSAPKSSSKSFQVRKKN